MAACRFDPIPKLPAIDRPQNIVSAAECTERTVKKAEHARSIASNNSEDCQRVHKRLGHRQVLAMRWF